jgi:putative phosphoribosyl transferase
VILGVPVASPEAIVDLAGEAEVVCLEAPHDLWAVGQCYRDFAQTSDEEVIELLHGADQVATPSSAGLSNCSDPGVTDTVDLPTSGLHLPGRLTVPGAPRGLVIFAHGSGSSRHSSRNRFVAAKLNRDGLATLLFDLLTVSEERDRGNVFDVELLAGRLADVTRWVAAQPETRRLPIGYFGASSGAAAALWAAADPDAAVVTVVSRGGRPDLAELRLHQVRAPTLLIVGGEDREVLRLNREARARMTCENQLSVVPGATHLFEEPGALAAAADLASRWIRIHLPNVDRSAA